MSTIKETSPPTAARRRDFEDNPASKITQTRVGSVARPAAGFLPNMVSVHCQPPAMRFQTAADGEGTIFDRVIDETLAHVARMSTGQLAYAVAELGVRRNAEIDQCDSEAAQDGLAVIEKLARMFEHLVMLQHWSEAGQ